MLTALVAVATVAGGLAAAGTLLSSLTRPSRLRRDEALWRQALQTSPSLGVPEGQRTLVQDLHRHTLARLIGIELVPARIFWTSWLFLVAALFLLASMSWSLTYAVADDPQTPWTQHLSDRLATEERTIAPIILIAGPLLSITWLLGAVSARHFVARAVLQRRYPIHVRRGPVFSSDALLLATAVIAGSLAVGTLGGLLQWSEQQSAPAALETVPAWLPGGALLLLSLASSLVTIRLVHPDGPLRRSAPDLSSAAFTHYADPSDSARSTSSRDQPAKRTLPEEPGAPDRSGHPGRRPGWECTLLVAALVASRARRGR